MRGYIGGGLSTGIGFPIVNLTKQKLNALSSNESEIVGVQDYMPDVFWTRYFMEAQGYQVMVIFLPRQQEGHSPGEEWEVIN